jgi:tetratricopeptide (TPR) repeat protein
MSKRRIAKLICAVALVPAAFSPPDRISAQAAHSPVSAKMESDFEAAMAAESRGDLERAEAILSALHQAHPGIFAIDESLGLVLVSRNAFDRALPLLASAVKEQPSSDAAHANLGATLYRLHRNAESIAEFQRAVKINPANVSAQQSLSSILMEEHRPAEAARASTAALALKPHDTDLQLDCATVLLAAGRTVEARQILSRFPDAGQSARAQVLLGEADEEAKNFDSAGKHFGRAVDLEPTEENAWLLGAELLRHWTFDAAVVIFEDASVKFPDSKRMRMGLGAALFGDTKYTEAIPVFADLLDAEPDNAQYAALLGTTCATIMRAARPRCASLIRYAQTHPGDALAAVNAAASLLGEADPESHRPLAGQLLQTALAADPKLPEAQFQMGAFLQDDGKWNESVPYLQKAIALKPDFAQAHYHLAQAYWRIGRKQEGQAEMEAQKKYSKQEKDDLQRRLGQITTFIVDVRN